MNQCELCYSYQDKSLSVLCDECKDKAAKYDIVEHNLKMAVKTIIQIEKDITEAMKDDTSENRATALIAGILVQATIAKQIYGDEYESQHENQRTRS